MAMGSTEPTRTSYPGKGPEQSTIGAVLIPVPAFLPTLISFRFPKALGGRHARNITQDGNGCAEGAFSTTKCLGMWDVAQ